jgi:hypothetical protein
MFKKIKEFFVGKPAPVAEPVVTAPYKVPEPATAPVSLVVTNSNPADNVPLVAEVTTPVVDQLAVVNAAEGSAVTAAPAKKPRKPRAPKAEVAAKPAAKKAATKSKKA